MKTGVVNYTDNKNPLYLYGSSFNNSNSDVADIHFYIGASVKNSGDILLGVYIDGNATVTNSGDIGLILTSGYTKVTNTGSITQVDSGTGGLITNGSASDTGATIDYVFSDFGATPTTVKNYGVITHSVDIGAGVVTNGAKATIGGSVTIGVGSSATGTLTNDGSILAATYITAVPLGSSEVVTNGSATIKTALIEGESNGIYGVGSSVTVTNFGLIEGLNNAFSFPTTAGVYAASAKISNGLSGTIVGESGVWAAGTDTINNLGLIRGTKGDGVFVGAGSGIVNGDTTAGGMAATIVGYVGVASAHHASLTNYGTVMGTSGDGVQFGAAYPPISDGPCLLINGSATETTALISGSAGGASLDATVGTVMNFGAIKGLGSGQSAFGIYLAGAGEITNGASGDTKALASGYDGVLTGGHDTTVKNYGTLTGAGAGMFAAGILLQTGGVFANGSATSTAALAQGYDGVRSGNQTLTLTNFGLIKGTGSGAGAGVLATGGGKITNGSDSVTTARIEGYVGLLAKGEAATLINFGTVSGAGTTVLSAGVYLAVGGRIESGDSDDVAALITGYDGVLAIDRSTVANYGTITGTGAKTLSAGVYLLAGGSLTNGGHSSDKALIAGYTGVKAAGLTATIDNYGTITSTAPGTVGSGVYVAAGGGVDNEIGGLVQGYDGVVAVKRTVKVTNDGTVKGTGDGAFAAGVLMTGDGQITNGGTANASALIQGYDGVIANLKAVTLTNFGTVAGTATTAATAGVVLKDGGVVTNGSQNAGGIIYGYDGVLSISGTTKVANYGAITGKGAKTLSAGVYLLAGGSLTNGGDTSDKALIVGYTGVRAGGLATTIDNWGTIASSAAGTIGSGVYVARGGQVFNEIGGLIAGYDGVVTKTYPVTITNEGTVLGSGEGPFAAGVLITGAGTVANGDAASPKALIQGYDGLIANLKAVTLTNLGTISGTSTKAGAAGVVLKDGGVVTNGSEDAGGIIYGYDGILSISGTTKVANYGAITGKGAKTLSAGVYLLAGGSLTNGGDTSGKALIVGYTGVKAGGLATTIDNWGTIASSAAGTIGSGVYVARGGQVFNEIGGLIEGYDGVVTKTYPVTITNEGTVLGSGEGPFAAGVLITGAGTVANGDAASPKALIQGYDGLIANLKAVTLTNLGTISGTSTKAGAAGVVLKDGGVVTNGSENAGGIIYGYDGVLSISGTTKVTNYGAITGKGAKTLSAGVYLLAGGSLTNGGDTSGKALIVGYTGVKAGGLATSIDNYGTIKGSAGGVAGSGIYMTGGGQIANESGGQVHGYDEIVAKKRVVTITNYGSVQGFGTLKPSSGIYLGAGGLVTNKAGALISGAYGVWSKGVATVINGGTVQGSSSGPSDSDTDGIVLSAGGQVTNGGPTSTAAAITGHDDGLFATKAAVTLANYGTIRGEGSISHTAGVYLAAGGMVTNGASDSTAALITGYSGIVLLGASSTVANFGTIKGDYSINYRCAGISVDTAGEIINGSQSDQAATIGGYTGIDASAHAAGIIITNFGSIVGSKANPNAAGVRLVAGGLLQNGDTASTSAIIQGFYGVKAIGKATIANYGTLLGTGSSSPSCGAVLFAGGSITNGALGDTGSLIEGQGGLALMGSAVATNLGTIKAIGTAANQTSAGVFIQSGGRLVNGSSGDAAAFIGGGVGVDVGSGAGTVTNYGVIEGYDGGPAVKFATAGSTLVVEAGAKFVGAVDGGGGTLVLASAGEIVSSFASGSVTVGGAIPTTVFTDFGTVKASVFDLSGSQTISGIGIDIFKDATLSGVIDILAPISGPGVLDITGTASFGKGAALSVSKVEVNGAGAQAVLAPNFGNLVFGGTWDQAGGTLDLGAGSKLDLTGAGNTMAGGLTGTGTLLVGAGVTDIGALDLLGGVLLQNSSTVDESGILGLGDGSVDNSATGVWDLTANKGVNVTADAGLFTNSGLFESTGTGTSVFEGSFINAGKVEVETGVLEFTGAVTGSGKAEIAAGKLYLQIKFTEAVIFTGSTGELELGDSRDYSGAITGFSTTGGTTLDLVDINYAKIQTPDYSGTASGGTLKVTDGAHSALIHLVGDFLGLAFTTKSDGHGGTLIATAAPPAPVAGFAAATAAFAPASPPSASPGVEGVVGAAGALARPQAFNPS